MHQAVVVAFATGQLAGRASSLGNEGAVLQVWNNNTPGPRPPLRVQGAALVTQDGREVAIHGVNW